MYKKKNIAERLGIAQKTVGEHFNGVQKPSRLYIYAYAYVLGVDALELGMLFDKMAADNG